MSKPPTAALSEVAQFINGRAFKPSEWTADGLPIIRIQNLTDSSASFNRHSGAYEQKHFVQGGDLLVSWSATLDVFLWDRAPALLNQHIFKVVPDPQRVQKRFLFYALKDIMAELRSKTHGTTMKHITKMPFQRTRIPLPPLKEQERIVKLLDAAEELRRLRAQADRRTADLIPALFHEMFGDPASGQNPWERKTLGVVLSTIDSGWSPTCPDRAVGPGEWGVLKLGAVTSCKYIDTENKALPENAAPRPELEVKAGDVLFTRKNTYELVAACALVMATRPRLMLSDLIFRLRIATGAGIIPEFLWALLVSPAMRKQAQRLASGSAGSMPNISKQRLKGLSIPIPPTDLQRQFAAHVAQTQALEARQAESRRRLDDLFQSLLHRAFRGEL